MICAALLYFRPENRHVWSSLIFLLSCVSVVIGGGFLAGLFLGVLGGVFGVTKRIIRLPAVSLFGDMFLYFLLAFIGNEADNALGADIFAVPFIYEGIFQLPLDIVRTLFTVAPFFYFAIRLFQAVITTLVATPLLRNLRAAGLSTSQFTEPKETEE